MKADMVMIRGKNLIWIHGESSTQIRREFPKTKTHTDGFVVPCTLLNMAIAHKYGCVFSVQLLNKKSAIQQKQIYDGELPSVLLPYQAEAVRKLIVKHGALLADEQGLGKTLQMITTIAIQNTWPVVVFCPAHLKHNWAREFTKWRPTIKYEILNGRTSFETTADVLICNYEIADDWHGELNRRKPKIIVCDEAHRIKNRHAYSTKAVLSIGKSPIRYMLTGTPLINSPENLWALVDAIDKKILGSKGEFLEYSAVIRKFPIRVKLKNGARFTRHVKKIVGVKNADILRVALSSSCMIRRTKAEVLPQLPEKIQTIVPVPILGASKMNKQIEAAVNAGLFQKGDVQKSFGLVYTELGMAKVDAAIQWVKDFIEQSDRPLIIAGWHREVASQLHTAFPDKSVMVIGGETNKERLLDKFQSGSKQILIGNIKAIGTGLTLTNASDLLFVELPMTVADLHQMADRIHRIGQNHVCNYTFLVAMDTVEEKLIKMLERKATMANKVLDGASDVSFSKILGEKCE